MTDPGYKDIQFRYLEEMRMIFPDILRWWYDNAQSAPSDIRSPETSNDFEKHWPAGPAGHPRILAIFRKYFLETIDLNDENRVDADTPPPNSDDLWGVDAFEEGRLFVLPVDLLVNDIQFVDPELFDVLQGIVFIPVGCDPNGEFC